MENSEKGSPVARSTNRALAAAGPIFQFLMRARDLEHPDACDFLAGNPQEIASTDYVKTLQRALIPDSRSYFAYGPPWQPAVNAAAEALGERLEMRLGSSRRLPHQGRRVRTRNRFQNGPGLLATRS